MNKKLVIFLTSVALLVCVGVAGTLMLTDGGSNSVGCEVRPMQEQVTLYAAVDSEDFLTADASALPSRLTVAEELNGVDEAWYRLEGEAWPELIAAYRYVKASEWEKQEPSEEATEETTAEQTEASESTRPEDITEPNEPVTLEGNVVIASDDAQLTAQAVSDAKVAEIETALDIPEAGENVTRETYCFDIHAEQDAPTTVTVSGIAQPGSTVNVYHLYDENDYTNYEILPCVVNADGSVTFETESFSEFYFTVDFHHGDSTYSITGLDSALLSEIFDGLGIDEDATQAERVVFSDETLLSVERQADGDWLLTSLGAFKTEETLTITFADGHTLTIIVTDASIGQQSTNDSVFISSSGILDTYQVLGNLYNSGVCVVYSRWGGSRTLDVYMYEPSAGGDDNNGLLGKGTCKKIEGGGTHMAFSSPNNRYWFYLFKSNRVTVDYEESKSEISFSAFSVGDRYIKLKAMPLAIGSKADNGYCAIRQVSEVSLEPAERNVVVRVRDLNGNLKTVKTYSNILFPKRKDSIDVNDIVVSDYSADQYQVSKSVSGSTYYVDLNPITYNVTVKAMSKGLGDKYGVGITGLKVTGGFYGDGSGHSSASAKFLYNTKFTVTAEVQDGYVFAGWYDGDSNTANLVSTSKTYTATLDAKSDRTLYARAVKRERLSVDCYYRGPNGLFTCAWGITGDPKGFTIVFNGDEITKNYSLSKNWYIVDDHSLIEDGTRERYVGDENNMMAVGTKNPNDTYYGTQGRFYYGRYRYGNIDADFWKAGVGLNIAALNYVYFDAPDQHWKYNYEWNWSYWTYNFRERTWEEHVKTSKYPVIEHGIEIPLDEGRVNFLYKKDPGPGANSFYLRYYPNGLGVKNLPSMQSVKNIDTDDYWFTVAGLGSAEMLPTREGHTFVGWSTDRNHDPSDTESDDIWTFEKFNKEITSDADFKSKMIQVMPNSFLNPKRLYAIWEKQDNSVTITYHLNYDDDPEQVFTTQTYEKNSLLSLSKAPKDEPSRPGYYFKGWCYEQDGTEPYTFGRKVYADIDLYAKWELIPYNVTGEAMKDALGDKKGSNLWTGGIESIEITDSNVHKINAKWYTDKKISGEYYVGEEFTLKANVREGYRFLGWYDSNEVVDGKPTGTLLSTDPVYKGTVSGDVTYYARAAEESLLAVDYYLRLSNGRYVYAHDWQTSRKIYGVEISRDYSEDKNWYLVAEWGLITRGTQSGVVQRVLKDDTNAMLVGTNNPDDLYYSEYNGFLSDYFKNRDKGHYYFGIYDYTDSSGTLWHVPFKMAGVGLDLVKLNNVYYDSGMRGTALKATGQTWKYGYRWTTSYWVYSIRNGWSEKTVDWEIEDIPIYEDEGRVNFVYEMATKKGNHDFYLVYHSNLASGKVSNIPAAQSMKKIGEDSYWFSIAGLYPARTQPSCSGTKDTYRFLGWSTNPNHGPQDDADLYTYAKYKQSLENGDFDWRQIEVKLNENSNVGRVHLYAIWQKVNSDDLTVTFDLNYMDTDTDDREELPSNIWKTVSVKRGEIASDPGVPTRSGYTFAGWYFTRESDAGTAYDRANTPVNNDLVVYAKWNPDYTVHYYLKGTTTRVAPDKVVKNLEVGSTVTETAPDFEEYVLVGDRTQTLTVQYSGNELTFYYTSTASYTICYYKDSVSKKNQLGECSRDGTIGTNIPVPPGTKEGELDYLRPEGYLSGVLVDPNVKITADGKAVAEVLYTADASAYTVNAYVMGTDGTYPSTPTYSESNTELTGKTVKAETDPAYWVGNDRAFAFAFDSENDKNRISDAVVGDGSTVLSVYFSRNQYSITWNVTKDDDPTYHEGRTDRYYFEQSVSVPSVEIPSYYTFDDWKKGGVSWPSVMPGEDLVIAGELVRLRTDLVISKSGMESGESAIFTVTGSGLGNGLRVVVENGRQVTVKGLRVGEEYTVTEESGWSWKYEPQTAVTRTLRADRIETISFRNVAKLIKWLTDEWRAENLFGKRR